MKLAKEKRAYLSVDSELKLLSCDEDRLEVYEYLKGQRRITGGVCCNACFSR